MMSARTVIPRKFSAITMNSSSSSIVTMRPATRNIIRALPCTTMKTRKKFFTSFYKNKTGNMHLSTTSSARHTRHLSFLDDRDQRYDNYRCCCHHTMTATANNNNNKQIRQHHHHHLQPQRKPAARRKLQLQHHSYYQSLLHQKKQEQQHCESQQQQQQHQRRRQQYYSVLSKEAATLSQNTPTYQRWYAIPPANAVHLAIGSVYVYSMWTPGMTTALGVVTSSSLDWTHGQILPVFSTSAVVLGITTSTLGSWVEKVGPRKAGFVGSCFWMSALLTTAAGVHLHYLPLIYGGWGLLGGIGWGLMYLCPITTVMKWFPDRRGLATGLALSAFGAGAAIAPAFIQAFIDYFAIAPDYIGPLQQIMTDSTCTTTSIADELSTSPAAATSATTTGGEYVTLETLPNGSQVVAENSPLGVPGTPVCVATETDLAKVHFSSHHIGNGGNNNIMQPGAYVLGSGDTGTSKAMACLGLCYGALGMLGSRFMAVPHPNWVPSTTKSSKTNKDDDSISQENDHSEANGQEQMSSTTTPNKSVNTNDIGLTVDYVTSSTRQFPLLWLSVFGNATGGLALLTSSKLMLTDIWTVAAPGIVTSSFATGYVAALGVGMAGGRFGWAAISDYLGRQNTYALFGLGIPIIGFSPYLTHAAVMAASAAASGGVDPGIAVEAASSSSLSSAFPMVTAFCGGSFLAITFYGGVFSVLPAYIADLFGQKHSGAIHGKLLTAWAASAVAGPMGLAYLRGRSVEKSTADLLQQVEDPVAFESAFGCRLHDTETVQTLIDAKTITIGRLMELVPAETLDPTPFLYDSSCYAAAGLMGVSLISNLLIKPIDVPKTLKELEEQKALRKQ